MVSAPERSDARANRQRIVAAALEVIAERGVAAEMKEIAERAGVGVGTIYRNFATKDDLMSAIIDEVLAKYQAAGETARAIADPAEAIRTYVEEMYAVLEEWSPVAMALISGTVPLGMKEKFLDYMQDPAMEQVFERGVASGAFRKDLDIAMARALLMNTCDPLIFMALGAQRTREQMAAAYADLVLRAVKA